MPVRFLNALQREGGFGLERFFSLPPHNHTSSSHFTNSEEVRFKLVIAKVAEKDRKLSNWLQSIYYRPASSVQPLTIADGKNLIKMLKDWENGKKIGPVIKKVLERLEKEITATTSELFISDHDQQRWIASLENLIKKNSAYAPLAWATLVKLDKSVDQIIPKSLVTSQHNGNMLPSKSELLESYDQNYSLYANLSQYHMDDDVTIVVFGTAREHLPLINYRRIANAGTLGVFLGMNVFSGGGPGAMEETNKGAVLAESIVGDDRRSAYVAIKLEFENPRRFADMSLRELMGNFIPRKAGLIHNSDIIISASGGYGTMDEIFEVLGAMQSGEIPPKPIVMYESSTDGQYWAPFIAYLKSLFDTGSIDRKFADLFFYAKNERELAVTLHSLKKAIKQTGKMRGGLHTEDYISHPSRYSLYKILLSHDHDIHTQVFQNLNQTRTISICGPRNGASELFSGQADLLVRGIAEKSAELGINILMNANNDFMAEAAQAAESALSGGALLMVEHSSDPLTDIPTSDRVGKVRLHTNPLFKAAMSHYSTAAVYFPGDIRTQDLLYEHLCEMQTQKVREFPIILVGGREQWKHFLAISKNLARYKTISPGKDEEWTLTNDRGLFVIVEDANEALDILNKIEFGTKLPEYRTAGHVGSSTETQDRENFFKEALTRSGVPHERAQILATTHAPKVDQLQLITGTTALLMQHDASGRLASLLADAERFHGADADLRTAAGILSLENDGSAQALLEDVVADSRNADPFMGGLYHLTQASQTLAEFNDATSPEPANTTEYVDLAFGQMSAHAVPMSPFYPNQPANNMAFLGTSYFVR